jgi:hypothetical protein
VTLLIGFAIDILTTDLTPGTAALAPHLPSKLRLLRHIHADSTAV